MNRIVLASNRIGTSRAQIQVRRLLSKRKSYDYFLGDEEQPSPDEKKEEKKDSVFDDETKETGERARVSVVSCSRESVIMFVRIFVCIDRHEFGVSAGE